MTTKEFMDEKKSQGQTIGQDIALKMMNDAEAKNQVQNKESELPDNLTGGQRQS